MSDHSDKTRARISLILACLVFPLSRMTAWFDHMCFVDGLTYGAVARNWAVGLGGFWDMHYTNYLYKSFFEHPPLFFFLEGLWFSLLGDHPFIEEVFMSLLWVVFMVCLFRSTRGQVRQEIWSLSLLVIALPGVYWSFANNMLESLIGVLAVVIWMVSAGGCSKFSKGFIMALLLGMLAYTKGPVMVPILMVLLAFLWSQRSFREMTFMMLFLMVIGGLSMSYGPSAQFWNGYIQKQIGGSLDQGMVTLSQIGVRMFPMVLGFTVLLLSAWMLKKKELIVLELTPKSWWVIVCGVLYMLPWLFFQKFHSHYLIPGWMIIVLGIASSIKEIKYQWSLKISAAMMIALIVLLNRSHLQRHVNAIELVKLSKWEERKEVYVENSLCYDWYLVAAFKRMRNIDVSCPNRLDLDIYKTENKDCPTPEFHYGYYLCSDE